MDTILIPKLEGKETLPFSKIFPEGEDLGWISPLFEITQNGELVQMIDQAKENQTERLLDLAEKQVAANGSTLLTHNITKDKIELSFWAKADFVDITQAQREMIARDTYRRFQQVRTIFESYPDTPITITFNVHMHTQTYEYDGVRLTEK
jgi:hypothetical protein